MNAAGESAYRVQERLQRVATAYGAPGTRISAFPTFMMVTMGRGEPASLEIVTSTVQPRLDQISALDRLVIAAEHGEIDPVDGLQRLAEISDMHPRFGLVQSIFGYA